MYILMQLAVSSLLRVVWEISDFFTMHARAPIPVYILGRFYSYTNIHYTPTLQDIHYTTYIPTLDVVSTFHAYVMTLPAGIDVIIGMDFMRFRSLNSSYGSPRADRARTPGRREAGGTKPGHVGHGRTGITGLGDHARWPPSGADR